MSVWFVSWYEDWVGNLGPGVDIACEATLGFDRPERGLVLGPCNLGSGRVVWLFATDGEDGVFEVSPTLSSEKGSASRSLWRDPRLLGPTGTEAEL